MLWTSNRRIRSSLLAEAVRKKQLESKIKSHMKSFSSVKILLILPVLLANAKEPTRGPEHCKTIHSWFKSDQRIHHQLTVQCLLAVQPPQMEYTLRGLSRNQRSKPRFGGSKTSDILFFFDKLIPTVQPQNIIFYCGENDIAKVNPRGPSKQLENFC